MVELAWLWLRCQPDSARARWFTERVGAVRGRIRKITAVALAQKLLVALWRYIRTRLEPEGAPEGSLTVEVRPARRSPARRAGGGGV